MDGSLEKIWRITTRPGIQFKQKEKIPYFVVELSLKSAIPTAKSEKMSITDIGKSSNAIFK